MMKINFEKLKLFFLTLFAILVGSKKVKPVEIGIYIEDNVDPEFVKNSLCFVPHYWNFTFLTEAPKYRKMGGEWETFLIPEADDTVVIFNGTLRNVKYAGGATGKSVGVSRFITDTSEHVFGLRIWHELLHAQHIDADAMIRCPEFENWLEPQFSSVLKDNKAAFEHSMQYQILFYNFLTWKLIKR
jgi:hypothetical protein